jgi:hypothetical protein
MSLVVIHVPAQCMEEWIGEVLPELGLVVLFLPADVRIAVERILVNKRLDGIRDCHYKSVALIPVKDVEIYYYDFCNLPRSPR